MKSSTLFLLLLIGILCASSTSFTHASPKKKNPSATATGVVVRVVLFETTPRVDTSVSAQPRRVAGVEKFARLPVWPVWQGVFLFIAGKILGEEVAANWEDSIGGRVCPNFFSSSSVLRDAYNGPVSPFVLLVHHRHSFSNWDPVRYIQRTFFPEGFPAHPHRGFVTITFCLKGGMLHRDSIGVKQSYGAETRHGGRHVQWLTAGAGIQHEEMWDVSEPDEDDRGSPLWTSSQELYQIWLNLPAAHKMSAPSAVLLEARDACASSEGSPPAGTTPAVASRGTVTTVICGEHDGVRAPTECPTDAAIMRVQMEEESMWTHVLPGSHETAILYVRKGPVEINEERIPSHYTVYLTRDGEQVTVKSPEGKVDFLLLSGAPIREPVASQGSMVMSTQGEIQKAYMDYQRGFMGRPWSEKLSDEEWRQHVKDNPSMY